MRKLGHTASDSLDLLLDTMCSMFGGIILIAILIVLLTQGKDSPPSAEQKATTEIISRKIAVALADLKQAQKLREQLGVPTDANIEALNAEKQRLQSAVDEARALQNQSNGQIADQVTHQNIDYTAESLALSQKLAEAERTKTELINTNKAQEQNSERLNARIVALDAQIQKAKEERVAKLRFPKERSKTKETFNIIVKYNRIYPLMNADGSRNKATISWEDDDDAHVPTPIREKGIDIQRDGAELARLLHGLSSEEIYFALYVCSDSFDTFKRIKDVVTQAGFDFGWEPVKPGTKLRFGRHGTSPPPL